MKKVLKKVEAIIQMTEMGVEHNCAYTRFEIECPTLYDRSSELNAEFYVEVEQPETLKEFLKVKNLKKKQLVNWLNENYKR